MRPFDPAVPVTTPEPGRAARGLVRRIADRARAAVRLTPAVAIAGCWSTLGSIPYRLRARRLERRRVRPTTRALLLLGVTFTCARHPIALLQLHFQSQHRGRRVVRRAITW